jgi:GNAT superfamily N-acetyltransferase
VPVEIRVVGEEDWQTWRDLRLAALLDTPIGFVERYDDAVRLTEADWRARLAAPDRRLLLASDETGRPVGIALGYLEAGRPTLGSVFVVPSARGQGVLAPLVDEVARWAREQRGAAELDLWVHEDNAPARRAYERLGFVMTDRSAPYDLDESRLEHRMLRPI